ncbi:MAG: DUF3782 domain-containing protein [SAR324 cluster bacterium]|nr:DUF3782 domain-containing protein [SAR324 cluster bacterium]MBF0351637.1 DUF3782 domain-containing protein [SAR324 cluster bacterium]
MTDDELKALVASLAIAQKETDQQIKELFQNSKATDQQIKEVSRNVGGLNNKFGSFTEGMAFPSISKIMEEQFGMETFLTRLKRKKAGEHAEIDAIAYANGKRNELFVIEVKSQLDKREVKQVLKILKHFREFFPEFGDKTLKGIIAYVDAKESAKEEVLKSGLYLASIHDGLFALETPDNFVPREF